MPYAVAEIAAALSAPFEGDGRLMVQRATEPQDAGPDDLAIALSAAYCARIGQGAARVAVVPPGTDWAALGLAAAIFAPRGRLAMARLTQALDTADMSASGIHATAVVGAGAVIADDVAIGAFCVVGAGAEIGPGTVIEPQVTIAPGAKVGAGCRLMSGVRLGPRVVLGDRVLVQFNAVIGSDGFSFVTETPSAAEVMGKSLGQGDAPRPVDPTWHRIHSLGGVVIGDDVEIGASCTIDGGTLRPTRIGRGTKLDNLVHVAHNVVVGADCLLCGQVGIAGSARVGDRVVMGGQSGIGDNLSVGDDVVLGGATAVLSNVPAGRIMLGYPAMPMAAQVESYKALRRLPRVMARLWGGEKPVSKPGETD